MTESVISAASEISKHLGKEKGAEFLSVISDATEARLDENLMSAAISNFFEQFRQEVLEDLQSGEPAHTNMSSKLHEISWAMNKGLDILIDKEKMLPERLERGEKPGLAFAMNNFFSTDFTVAENGGHVTTMGFNFYLGSGPLMDRIEGPHAKELEWQENGPLGPGQYLYLKIDNNITAQEFSGAGNSGIISKVADFLRTGIGNDKAAEYLENMADDSKIIDAMDATISIVAMENGFDKASEYVSYLNGELKNAINLVAQDSIFDGWILHAKDKTFKPQGSGLTLAAGGYGPGGLDGIFQKGHLALQSNWRMMGGPGIGGAIDLNELYGQLS